jgi:hypothetical protein
MPTKILKDQNHLFHSIPELEWDRFLPYIEIVEMSLGMVLCRPGMKLSHAYFPSTSIVSILHDLEDGTSAEVAAVGNEGLIGISIFMAVAPLVAQPSLRAPGWVTELDQTFFWRNLITPLL